MHSAIKPIIRTLVFCLLSVLMIAAVLVAGTVAVKAFHDYRVSSDDWQAVRAVQAELVRYREEQAANLARKLHGADKLPLAAVDRRIHDVTRALRAGLPPKAIDLHALLRAGPRQYAGQLASHYKAELDRALAAQELAYLQQVRAQLVTLAGRAGAQRELARLQRLHVAAYGKYLEKKREVDRLGYLGQRLMEREWTRTPALHRLASDVAARIRENEQAAARYRAQKAALDRIGLPQGLRPYVIDAAALDRAVQPLDALVAEVGNTVSAHPVSRIAGLVLPALPVAAGILLVCLAGRVAVRALLYFVLAPLVTRRPPVQLDRAGQGMAAEALSASAVSQAIRLDPDEELLVLPRYLQSTPVAALKSTRWLLQGRPWTSLVSGMALLTCVRTRSRDEGVVLSAVDGELGELALIRVPAGSALVFQPRALVGLVCDRNAPLQVEQRWRLTSLHAWLTLQLRYFLIRGPVTLVLQGRRGVRVGQADGDHLVRQSATLGFSADVAYSTLRSAPFLPYLQGQTDLLYDRFSGGQGIYVHDETPATGRAGGRIKRGLEGLSDGVLKVFGL
ncbi:MAG: hypothetical protein ABWY02_06470 [Telluria sp.]